MGLLFGSAFLGAAAMVAVIWFWLRDLEFALLSAPVGASVAALIASLGLGPRSGLCIGGPWTCRKRGRR